MRNHLVAPPGEFVGTFLFLFFAFLGYSVSVTSAPNYAADGSNSNQTVIYTSLSYGLPLLVTAWDLFRISGGLSNPAVTPGLVVTGQLPRIRGVIFFPVQLLGGVCAAAVASAIIPGDIAVTQTTLGNGVSVMQGLFLEVLFTSLLVLTILMLAVNKSKATFIIPIGIGMALFVTQISGVCYIGNSLNTARSFGPCVATAKFQGYHCIYWVGPFLGAFFSGGYVRTPVFGFAKHELITGRSGTSSSSSIMKKLTPARTAPKAPSPTILTQGAALSAFLAHRPPDHPHPIRDGSITCR